MKKLRLILLFSVGIFLTVSLTAYAQDYTEIQLTDDILTDFLPQINDKNQVAWFGGDKFLSGGTDNEVFFYDGITTHQITDNDINDQNALINNKGHILWLQSNVEDETNNLILFDGVDSMPLPTSGTYQGSVDFNDNDFAVWQENGYCVYYDGGLNTTKFEATLDEYPNAIITLTSPKINNQGRVVLNGGIKDGFFSASAIFLFDGSTLSKVIGLTPSPYYNRNPQINDNDYIVWERRDGTDYEIFLYDGSTITQLTNNEYDDADSQINNNGHVTWNSAEGIFVYDGSTTTKLSGSGIPTGNSKINDIGYVVWSEMDGNDWEIFLYNQSEIIQITNNDYDDMWPQINNNNYITWQRSFGSEIYTEIFIAKPEAMTIEVDIDIEPNNEENCVNINEHGIIALAILGSSSFDVTTVDPSSCELQGMTVKVAGKSNEYLSQVDDVNLDGYNDLLLKIEDSDGSFDEGQAEATLTGKLYDEYGGTAIEGSDLICIFP